jgi:hypothetical protein
MTPAPLFYEQLDARFRGNDEYVGSDPCYFCALLFRPGIMVIDSVP